MATATASSVVLDDGEHARLSTQARSRTASHHQVLRARIVLAVADGTANAVIARRLSISQDTVRTWRDRLAAQGLAGLADRPRPGPPTTLRPGRASTDRGHRHRATPEADSAWTHRLIAEHLTGISGSQVGGILVDLDLKPHRVRGWLTRP